MTQRLLVVLILFVISVGPSGCSPQTARKNTGVITGKVIYQGEPVPGGAIHFFMGDGPPLAFAIRGDGTFVAEVPVGPAQIAVETDSAKYKGSREEMMKKWRALAGPEYVDMKQEKTPFAPPSGPRITYKEIPARFSDPSRSGLTHDVVPGPQQRDFELN
jgi:hypothetical protein